MATDNQPSNFIGAYQAKVHFSDLLQQVEAGAEVTITRHGAPVARMIPVKRQTTPEIRRAAVERIGEMRAELSLGKWKVKDLIAEGRR
jgi:prevent-host-death family protein